MNKIMIIVIAAGAFAVFSNSGCGEVLKNRSIEVGGLVIRNRTGGPLYDIKLRVERTGAVVTCNFIPAGGDFSTEFPIRRYQGNSVQVAWRQNGRNFVTGRMYAQMPDVLNYDSSATAAVIIGNNGTAVIRLEQ